MLTIDFKYFRDNPELLLSEIIKTNECGLIEFNGLGHFEVNFVPIEAANDGSFEGADNMN